MPLLDRTLTQLHYISTTVIASNHETIGANCFFYIYIYIYI